LSIAAVRLDKFIGHSSDLSRAQIQRAIRRGAVTVNGEPARKASEHIAVEDCVRLDGEVIAPPATRYLMLHKPAGYLCANDDGQHPTVLDLIELPNRYSLQIVGRLDLDTTGLLLLTDDGKWNHRITSPRSECTKTYRVTTADPINKQAAEHFRAGILLQGEKHPTRPAELEQLGDCEALLTIHEGKYHQVKRMFAAEGNRVVGLHREQIGPLQLDAGLAPGEYRFLSTEEVASF
jgi:16S rRNA pseudouridine516 synthase